LPRPRARSVGPLEPDDLGRQLDREAEPRAALDHLAAQRVDRQPRCMASQVPGAVGRSHGAIIERRRGAGKKAEALAIQVRRPIMTSAWFTPVGPVWRVAPTAARARPASNDARHALGSRPAARIASHVPPSTTAPAAGPEPSTPS